MWLLRIPNGAFLAILIAILDILPVLGTGIVLIPWAIITMIQGNAWLGVGLLVLYAVITMIRNALEPPLVGRQINLHPILTFAGADRPAVFWVPGVVWRTASHGLFAPPA